MAESQLDVISQLANTLGGSQTTSNAGNIGGLENVLAQLQGQGANSEALLQSIFQKAAGQIPGFQRAYANSAGARSGGNSAINAALANLLKETTLAGQSQLAQQQAQNLQTQGQVAGSIANATKGTTQQSGANLGNAAKNLAILKLLSESGLMKKGGLSSLFGGTEDTAMTSAPTDMTGFVQPSAPISYSPSPDAAAGTPFTSLDQGFTQDFTAPVTDLFLSAPAFDLNDYGGGPQMPAEEIPADYEQQWFADGGLVGNAKPETEDEAEDAAQQRFEPGHTTNRVLDILQTIIKQDGKMQASNFADGGLVTQRAAGGRRSSAPQIQTTAPEKTGANNTLPREQLAAPVPTLMPAAPETMLTPDATMQISGSGKGNVGMNEGMGQAPESVRQSAKTLMGINNVLGASGMGGIQGLGVVGGLTRARTPQEALGTAGMAALGMLSPVAASAAQAVKNPTAANMIDVGVNLTPAAPLNMLANLFGYSAGGLLAGTPQIVNPATGEVMSEAYSGLFGADVAGVNPVSGPGAVETADLGFLGGGRTSGTSQAGGSSEGGLSKGDAGSYADGGNIPGIEDNKQINVSGGEFVVSKDVVDAIGVDFFEALQQALHTPAAVQRAMA